MDPTILDLLTAGGDEDLRSKAQVMAAQLRGDRQLGMMGQIGGKRAAGLGREMLSDADSGEKAMLTAGIANQGTNFKQQKLIGDFEKAMAVQGAKNEASDQRGRDMLEIAALRAAGGDKTRAKEESDHYKKLIEFTNKNNPYQQSGRNPLGLRQNLLGQADRIQALVDSGDNPDVKITSQLVREMEMGLAALGSSGASGQVAKSAVDEIANKTLGRHAAEWTQWVTGHPQDARAKEFIKQAIMTIKREHDTLTRQQREGVARSAIGYRRSLFHPSNEADATAWLKDSGYDDQEIAGLKAGKYTPTPRGKTAAAKAPTGASGGRFTHPQYPGKFFDADGNEVQ